MSAQSSYLNKKGLTVKDLVTIGIFTALFFVFELIGSLAGNIQQYGAGTQGGYKNRGNFRAADL